MLKMLPFLHQYRAKAVMGLVFKMLAAGMELTIPLIMSRMINNAPTQPQSYIYQLGGLILLVVLVNITFDLICQYFASVSSAGIGEEIRSALFQRINSLSFAELDQVGSASLVTRVTNDVTQVQQATAMGIRLLSRAPFMAVGALLMATSINLPLSFIFLAVVLLVLGASAVIRNTCAPMYTAVQHKLDMVVSGVKETLEGIRVFSAFNMQGHKVRQFGDASTDYQRAVMRVNRIAALLSPATFLIINMAVVAVVWFGGRLSGMGRMPAGDIIALTTYLFQVLIAMNVITNLIVLFTRAEASAKRIGDVLAMESSLKETPNAAAVQHSPDEIIRFDRVSFQYANAAKPVLRDISFTIRRGQRIGIIGGTGQGKTTLINLIDRCYDAASGSITVAGVDVRDWDLAALRDFISIARQKAELLSLPIRDNIRFGQAQLSDADIERAAKMAEADEFIARLEGGYGHKVEQEGRNLSGGQKQRLSLARAFARNSEILILDNSLSALDFLTESRVRAHIASELADVTVVFVSERVATLKHCDNILVLDGGALIAEGDHEQLMEGCELYREIAASQLG